MIIIRIAVKEKQHPSLKWWAERLARAFEKSGTPAETVYGDAEHTAAAGCGLITARLGGSPAGTEGFLIKRNSAGASAEVIGKDIQGLCYGLDEITRHINGGGSLSSLKDMEQSPRFLFRAVKFNLPWSCYRSNVSVTIHRETVRDLAFWDAFLDMLAEHRFNVLTLWNVHPYPFMTRAKSFPLACELTDAELEDWRGFWNGLFYRCKQRCIRPFVMSMNINLSEGFRKNYDPDVGTDAVHWGPAHITPNVEKYLRESVTQIIDEYPDLAGVGTSLGEHMNGITPEEREGFRDRVYNEAVRRASRPVEILWRAPFSANTNAAVTRGALENAGLPPAPIWMEIKYNFSHGYSSPKLLAAHGVTRDSSGGADKVRDILKDYWEPEPEKYKMVLMVRNEDFFVLRWAEPGYVRAHIAENDKSYVGGYFIGSEGFIPAKEYTHCPGHSHVTWRYAFEKNRLYYMIWGRLLFDPKTPDSVFERDIEKRLGAGTGAPLLAAYGHACKMPMALATFHSATWDFSLYSEGFISTRFHAHMFTDWKFNGYAPGKSFITLEHLMNCQTLDPGWLNAREYAEGFVYGKDKNFGGKVTPPDVASALENDAAAAEVALEKISAESGSVLECETADVRAWIALSRYFACKLRAAAAMSVFLVNHDMEKRREAVRWLDKPNAKTHWLRLIAVTETHYRPMPLVSLGTQAFDWRLFLPEVEADIRFAEGHH